MNQDPRDRFGARDALGIVASQVDDGALPLMCESVFESAQFALMLIQAKFAGADSPEAALRVRGVDAAAGMVLLDVRVRGATVPVGSLPVSNFTPQQGESLVPFLARAVSALLDVCKSKALHLAA
jgi:hypothetical protein